MPRFIIERTIPGAASLDQDQLREIARTSNEAVDSLGVPYRWLHSYVAGDKFYCVHETENVDIVKEHARRGGFPCDLVAVVSEVIDPRTAD